MERADGFDHKICTAFRQKAILVSTKAAADGIKQDGWEDNALPEAQAAGE